MSNILKGIDSAFRWNQYLSIAIVVLCLVMVGIFEYYREINNQERYDSLESKLDHSYVLVGGSVHEIERVVDKTAVRKIEAIGHIKKFHELFFNLTPDAKKINQQVSIEALNLIDNSGQVHFDHLTSKGYFREIISGNVEQFIELNKPIEIDTLDDYRVRFRVDATQFMVRSTSLVKRSLVTQGYLRDLGDKTPDNLFGFLIVDWDVIENDDLEVIKR